MQEAFLELVRCERSDVETRARAWLFTVTRNRALDLVRKERPMHPIDLVDRGTAADAQPDPAGAAVRRETLARVEVLLAVLPDTQREVLELKFRHGLSYREIADVTQHSIGHVGWLIHHGIRNLRRRLDPLGVETAGEATA